MGRSHADVVDGVFEVSSVVVHDISDGRRTLRVTGYLVSADGYGPMVTTMHGQAVIDPEPEPGERVPATWRRSRPDKCHIAWGDGFWASAALSERDTRARALGIDPATLSRGPEVFHGASGAAAVLHWATNNAPLPDETLPVEAEEAQRLLVHGVPARAQVLAVDFLRLAPDVAAPPGATVANVALFVRTDEGRQFRALARFGFRTPQRRAQIGHVGAEVPVRVDRLDPTRIALDSNRLPPIPD